MSRYEPPIPDELLAKIERHWPHLSVMCRNLRVMDRSRVSLTVAQHVARNVLRGSSGPLTGAEVRIDPDAMRGRRPAAWVRGLLTRNIRAARRAVEAAGGQTA